MRTLLPVLLALLLLAGLAACLPAATPLAPLPTATPLPPTGTPTPTIVWFPPTATYTPRPSPAVVITPTVDVELSRGALILEDDFSEEDNWSLSRTATGSAALGKNELTIAIAHPGGYVYSLRRNTSLKDYYLEITASPSLCRGEDEYGLLIRVSKSQEFYRYSLNCQGQVRLDKYFNGSASSPKSPFFSGAVPPGAPSMTRLGVLVQGKEMQFFANNQHLFTVNDPSLPSGTIGVFARSNGENAVTVNFSDLQVYEAQ